MLGDHCGNAHHAHHQENQEENHGNHKHGHTTPLSHSALAAELTSVIAITGGCEPGGEEWQPEWGGEAVGVQDQLCDARRIGVRFAVEVGELTRLFKSMQKIAAGCTDWDWNCRARGPMRRG